MRSWLSCSPLVLLPVLLFTPADLSASDDEPFVRVADHRLYLHCSGPAAGPTVVLEAGAGAGAADWSKVQSLVERSFHVCSYDRAGFGKSGKVTEPVSEAALISDLHDLLATTHQPTPFVLVGHSLGGIYSRAFASRFPALVKGLVLVDSSHEEQLNRYTAISEEVGKQFSSQQGRLSPGEVYRVWGQLRAGESLQWRVDLPLIVIEHHRPAPALVPTKSQTPDEQIGTRIAQEWHTMQVDLVRRSAQGELREARGGHNIPQEQPEIVAQAIADVVTRMNSKASAPR